MNDNQNQSMLSWRERNKEELRIILAIVVFLCARCQGQHCKQDGVDDDCNMS